MLSLFVFIVLFTLLNHVTIQHSLTKESKFKSCCCNV